MRSLALWAILLPAGSLDAATPGSPAWRNLGPGGGGWIQSICAGPHDANELFVGCDVGGFYRSADGGRSYSIRNAGLQDYWVECIAPHPRDANVIYLGCESGVYKSSDRGQSWRWLRDGFPPKGRYRWTAPIGALLIDPKAPETLYAGIGRPRLRDYGAGAVFKTTDGGAHWARINEAGSLPANAWISDLLLDPRGSGHLYLACQHGVFQSRDAGKTWKPTVEGLPHGHARRLALCRERPEVIYLTVRATAGRQPWQGGVYKSTDGGNRWRPCLDGLAQRVSKPGEAEQKTFNYDRLAVHPRNPDISYVGGLGWGNHRMYKTTDGGRRWKSITNIADPGWITFNAASVTCLSMSPFDPDVLYWGSSMHVFRTSDGGATWRQRYCRQLADGRFRGTGLEVTCMLNVFVHPGDPKRLYFGYADLGLLVSTDAGSTFRRSVEGIDRRFREGPLAMAFDPADAEHCWAAFGWRSTSGRGGVVAESTDGGRTWRQVGTPKTGLPAGLHRALLVDPASSRQARRLLTIATGHGVYSSEDGGHTWGASNNGIAAPGSVRDLVAHPTRKGVYWCVTSGAPAAVYRTDDGARTWRRAGRDLRAGTVCQLVVAASDARRMYLTARSRYVEGRGVVWPTSWIDSDHASVLDSDLLAKELVLLLELLVVACEPDTCVDAVGGPAAGRCDGVVGEGNDLQDGRFDAAIPSGRQRNVWKRLIAQGKASVASLVSVKPQLTAWFCSVKTPKSVREVCGPKLAGPGHRESLCRPTTDF